jgi:hypothetical protein
MIGVPCFVGRGRDVIFSMRYSYACEVAFLRERRAESTFPAWQEDARFDELGNSSCGLAVRCEIRGNSETHSSVWQDDAKFGGSRSFIARREGVATVNGSRIYVVGLGRRRDVR